jgi:hypothetical protein
MRLNPKGFCRLSTILLEFPVSVVEWADLTRLQPSRNAVKMERVIANTPSHSTLLTSGRRLIRLTFDAKVHDVVPADSAVVDNNIPSPKGYRIPLECRQRGTR